MVQVRTDGLQRVGSVCTQGRTTRVRRRGDGIVQVKREASGGLCGGLKGKMKVDGVDRSSLYKIDKVECILAP